MIVMCAMLLITNVWVPTPVYGMSFGGGSATILWDSLEITTSPGLTIVFDVYSTRANIQGSSPYLNKWEDNWSNDNYLMYQAATSDYNLYGLAEARTQSSSNLYAESSVLSDSLSGSYNLKSTAQWWVTFHVIGNGNMSVGIQYSLASSLVSDLGDEAYGWSLAYAQIMNYGSFPIASGQTQSHRETESIGSNLKNVGSYSNSLAGWLYTDINFIDGDYGAFNIWAQAGYWASSPIQETPEPATMLLLSLGLMGLAGVRRKLGN